MAYVFSPKWALTIVSVSSDGGNLYYEFSISNGTITYPNITQVFEAGTTTATINTHMQAIVDNPTSLSVDYATDWCGRVFTTA